MKQIPTKIKNLVIDKNWNDTFIFEEMECEHSPNIKEHVKVNCNKCNYDKREVWLETILDNITGKETYIDKNNKSHTISKIKIIRGVYDDVIGIEKEYD